MPKVNVLSKAKLAQAYKEMGVDKDDLLFQALVDCTFSEMQHSDVRRIDKRALRRVLYDFIQSKKSEHPLLEHSLLSDALRLSLTKLKPKSTHSFLLGHLAKKTHDQQFLVMATPKTKERFQSNLDDVGFNHSTLQYCPLSPVREQPESSFLTPIKTVDGVNYARVISGPSLNVYSSVTTDDLEPIHFDISSAEVDTLRYQAPVLFTPKPDTFSFTITKEGIQAREGASRHISQNKIVGMSAIDVFKQFGAVIIGTPHGRFFHHAHRHGWGLGGAQVVENLDIGTAGSNYQTLFFIEAPAKDKVLKDGEIIAVEGKVYYDGRVPVPQKIVYELTWGDSPKIRKSIYPLCPQKPSLADHMLAKAAFSSVQSPEKKRRLLEPCDTTDDDNVYNRGMT